MIDPYKVLGVSPNATEDEIKKAYRQKAKEYHPDLHPNDPAAAQKMNEVNEAYDMLKNPEKYERRKAQEKAQNAYRQQNRNDSGYSGQSGYYSGYGQQNYRQNTYGYQRNYSDQYDYDEGGYSYGFGGFNFNDFFGGFSSGRQNNTRPYVQAGDPPDLAKAINAINAGRFRDAIAVLSAMTSSYRNARWYYVSAVAYHGAGDQAQALNQIRKAAESDPDNRIYQQLLREYSQSSQSDETYYYRRSSGFSFIRMIGIVILVMFIMRLLFSCMTLGVYRF